MILIFCYGTHGSGCGVAHTDDPTFTYTHVLTSARFLSLTHTRTRIHLHTHIHIHKHTQPCSERMISAAFSCKQFWCLPARCRPVAMSADLGPFEVATLLNIIARQYGLGTLRHGFSVGIRAALFALLFFRQKLWFCFRNICFHIWIAHCLALPC